MIRPALAFTLAALAFTGGCDTRPDDTPLVVSAIGGAAKAVAPSRARASYPDNVLMAATAQGLVRFDAAGQVEPALADRWIVIDDGRTYIFRLGDAQWPSGEAVTADAVVRIFDRARARGSRNPLAPALAVIDSVTAMTPQVVEIQLAQPRPDMLRLFAAPELAIFDPRTLGGSGPFRLRKEDAAGKLLQRIGPAPIVDDEGGDASAEPAQVRLFGERSALAIARFASGMSDVVLGGTYRDWPLVGIADIDDRAVRTDPTEGLFGLRVVERSGFLADADNRAAIAMAIDRDALLADFRADWAPVETIMPHQFDSAEPPARPGWAGRPLDARRAEARERVAVWKAERARDHDDPVAAIRVAVPDGPGGTLLWSHIGRAIAAIGLPARRVSLTADADLRVADMVAPYENLRWYLDNACAPCSDEAREAIAAVGEAPDLDQRAERLASADVALTADAAFIPLAEPLRWSLVGGRADLWQANARAWHPLNHLRSDPR